MGRLIAIARTHELRAPMEAMERARVSVENGIAGDARGRKVDRQVTVLFREGWEDACHEVGVDLPWLTRRANLYVEGLPPPQASGGRLSIGRMVLEITKETAPCELMERAQEGLRAAMTPEWRGGVCCRVLSGGDIAVGDAVTLEG